MSVARQRGDGSQGLLWGALGSVVLHLLLLLLTLAVPLRSATPVSPPETRIRFSFAPHGERDSPGPAPLPATEPLAAARMLEPRPPVESAPAPVPAPAPEPPAPAPPAAAGAVIELPDESLREPYRETAERGRPEPSAVKEERPIDLDRALREFDRALSDTRPRNRPAPSGPATDPVFVPDPLSVPTTGYGVGNLEFSSRDFDWSDYGRQVYIAIWRAWHNRLLASSDSFERWAFRNRIWQLEHAAGVVFTIRRNGEVVDIAVTRASTCVPLDQSAVDALEEVVLPPLPSGFPRDRETVRASFVAMGDVRGMRRYLEYLKRRGVF